MLQVIISSRSSSEATELLRLTMGSQQAKEVVRYVESDESKRIRLLGQLDRQLEALRLEVTSVKPAIQDNVRETVSQVQDALLMRYNQLTDKVQITQDIRRIFAGFPILSFLVDTATRLVSTMSNSQELQEILRWQEQKMVKRIGDKVYGLEAHYKVKILEESKGSVPGFRSKDTVVLIAYKCIAHAMDLDPEDFPDENEYKQITF